MQPTIVERAPENVLYVREKGDYAKTPEIALNKLFALGGPYALNG